MTVDQYTSKFCVNDYVEIKKEGEIVFKGTIKELQELFYTLGQCIIEERYQLTEHSHYIKL